MAASHGQKLFHCMANASFAKMRPRPGMPPDPLPIVVLLAGLSSIVGHISLAGARLKITDRYAVGLTNSHARPPRVEGCAEDILGGGSGFRNGANVQNTILLETSHPKNASNYSALVGRV